MSVNPSDYRPICFDRYDKRCQNCSSTDSVEVHHIDGDRTNNVEDNLIPLCPTCHQQVHKETDHKSILLKTLHKRLPEESIHTGPETSESSPNIVRTHVSLKAYQIEWARENNINLSAEIRDALDERMGFDDA